MKSRELLVLAKVMFYSGEKDLIGMSSLAPE
jgi:hypothetical protein